MSKTFKDLIVWQKSHELVLLVYKHTKDFPNDERYGLTSQMRRAAVSIAANIAEGSKRKSDKDYAHFLNMSEGSLEELKYYFILSNDLNYCNVDVCATLQELANEVGRLLAGFIKKLKA